MKFDGSFWMDIKPTERRRTVTMITLKLADDGEMTGTISQTYFGYAAIRQRKRMSEFQDEKSYLEKQKAASQFWSITSYERSGEDRSFETPRRKIWDTVNSLRSRCAAFLVLTRFLVGRTETNPFKADTRMFPHRLRGPMDESITIVIEFPETFEVASMPDKVGLALPNAGGRYIFGSQVTGNKLTMNNVLGIARPVFAPEEYPYLKEVYSKMLQAQAADVIFQRKK